MLPTASLKQELAKALEPGEQFSTFGGNPVCCAAGLASLDVLKGEGLLHNSASRGKQLMKLLAEVKEKHPQVGEVRGKGLMVGVELVLDSKKTPAQTRSAAVKSEMLKLGFLVGLGGIHRNVIRLQPPLVITAEEIDDAVRGLEKAINASFH